MTTPLETLQKKRSEEFDSLIEDYEENHKWFPTFRIGARNLHSTSMTLAYQAGLDRAREIAGGMLRGLPVRIDLEVDAVGAADAIRSQGFNIAVYDFITALSKESTLPDK